MRARAISLGLALAAAHGCGPNVFACDEDSDCAGSDGTGLCEMNGYCSFPDESCASGRRYGERSPAGIASTCTPVGDETGDASGPGSTSADTTSSSTAQPGSSGGTQMVDDSSGSASSPTTTPPTSTEPPGSTSSSDAGSTASEPMVVQVPASLAVCTEAELLDIEHCAEEAGVGQFTLDISDNDGNHSTGWLRFDLDDALQGWEILDVELVLRVGSDDLDESDQSGELWTVTEFDAASLAMMDPTQLELAAADLGPVALDAEVVFELSPDLVVPGSSLCFGLFAITSDGLDYWGHRSDTPPTLVITAAP